MSIFFLPGKPLSLWLIGGLGPGGLDSQRIPENERAGLGSLGVPRFECQTTGTQIPN